MSTTNSNNFYTHYQSPYILEEQTINQINNHVQLLEMFQQSNDIVMRTMILSRLKHLLLHTPNDIHIQASQLRETNDKYFFFVLKQLTTISTEKSMSKNHSSTTTNHSQGFRLSSGQKQLKGINNNQKTVNNEQFVETQTLRLLFYVVSLRIKLWFEKKDFQDLFTSLMINIEHNRKMIPLVVEMFIEMVEVFEDRSVGGTGITNDDGQTMKSGKQSKSCQPSAFKSFQPSSFNKNRQSSSAFQHSQRSFLTRKTNNFLFSSSAITRKTQKAIKQLNETIKNKSCFRKENKFQRQFVNTELNKLLIFANECFKRAVVQNPRYDFDQQQDDPFSNINSNQYVSSQPAYFIKLPIPHITKILNLIQRILMFDFFGDRQYNQQDEYFMQKMPQIIPTKNSKFYRFEEIQNWVKNKADVYKYQYLYFFTNDLEIKITIVRLFGDLLRIHQKFFKKQMLFKIHIETVMMLVKNMLDNLEVRYAEDYELAIIFGECINKLLLSSTFPTFINLTKPEFKKQFIESVGNFVQKEILQLGLLDVRIVRYFVGFFVQLTQKLSINSSLHFRIKDFKQQVDIIVNRLGEMYEQQLYDSLFTKASFNPQFGNYKSLTEVIEEMNHEEFELYFSLFRYHQPIRNQQTISYKNSLPNNNISANNKLYRTIGEKSLSICCRVEYYLAQYEKLSKQSTSWLPNVGDNFTNSNTLNERDKILTKLDILKRHILQCFAKVKDVLEEKMEAQREQQKEKQNQQQEISQQLDIMKLKIVTLQFICNKLLQTVSAGKPSRMTDTFGSASQMNSSTTAPGSFMSEILLILQEQNHIFTITKHTIQMHCNVLNMKKYQNLQTRYEQEKDNAQQQQTNSIHRNKPKDQINSIEHHILMLLETVIKVSEVVYLQKRRKEQIKKELDSIMTVHMLNEQNFNNHTKKYKQNKKGKNVKTNHKKQQQQHKQQLRKQRKLELQQEQFEMNRQCMNLKQEIQYYRQLINNLFSKGTITEDDKIGLNVQYQQKKNNKKFSLQFIEVVYRLYFLSGWKSEVHQKRHAEFISKSKTQLSLLKSCTGLGKKGQQSNYNNQNNNHYSLSQQSQQTQYYQDSESGFKGEQAISYSNNGSDQMTGMLNYQRRQSSDSDYADYSYEADEDQCSVIEEEDFLNQQHDRNEQNQFKQLQSLGQQQGERQRYENQMDDFCLLKGWHVNNETNSSIRMENNNITMSPLGYLVWIDMSLRDQTVKQRLQSEFVLWFSKQSTSNIQDKISNDNNIQSQQFPSQQLSLHTLMLQLVNRYYPLIQNDKRNQLMMLSNSYDKTSLPQSLQQSQHPSYSIRSIQKTTIQVLRLSSVMLRLIKQTKYQSQIKQHLILAVHQFIHEQFLTIIKTNYQLTQQPHQYCNNSNSNDDNNQDYSQQDELMAVRVQSVTYLLESMVNLYYNEEKLNIFNLQVEIIFQNQISKWKDFLVYQRTSTDPISVSKQNQNEQLLRDNHNDNIGTKDIFMLMTKQTQILQLNRMLFSAKYISNIFTDCMQFIIGFPQYLLQNGFYSNIETQLIRIIRQVYYEFSQFGIVYLFRLGNRMKGNNEGNQKIEKNQEEKLNEERQYLSERLRLMQVGRIAQHNIIQYSQQQQQQQHQITSNQQIHDLHNTSENIQKTKLTQSSQLAILVTEQNIHYVIHAYTMLAKYVQRVLWFSFISQESKQWLMIRNREVLPYMTQLCGFLGKYNRWNERQQQQSKQHQQDKYMLQQHHFEQHVEQQQFSSSLQKLFRTLLHFIRYFLGQFQHHTLHFVSEHLSLIQNIYLLIEQGRKINAGYQHKRRHSLNLKSVRQMLQREVNEIDRIVVFKCAGAVVNKVQINIDSREYYRSPQKRDMDQIKEVNRQQKDQPQICDSAKQQPTLRDTVTATTTTTTTTTKKQLRVYSGWSYIKRLYSSSPGDILQQIQQYQVRYKYKNTHSNNRKNNKNTTNSNRLENTGQDNDQNENKEESNDKNCFTAEQIKDRGIVGHQTEELCQDQDSKINEHILKHNNNCNSSDVQQVVAISQHKEEQLQLQNLQINPIEAAASINNTTQTQTQLSQGKNQLQINDLINQIT